MSQFWKLAHLGTVLSKLVQVGELNGEFDLNQVKGNVIITKKETIPPFQTIIVKGLTEVTGHYKCVHVLVEPSLRAKTFLFWVIAQN